MKLKLINDRIDRVINNNIKNKVMINIYNKIPGSIYFHPKLINIDEYINNRIVNLKDNNIF